MVFAETGVLGPDRGLHQRRGDLRERSPAVVPALCLRHADDHQRRRWRRDDPVDQHPRRGEDEDHDQHQDHQTAQQAVPSAGPRPDRNHRGGLRRQGRRRLSRRRRRRAVEAVGLQLGVGPWGRLGRGGRRARRLHGGGRRCDRIGSDRLRWDRIGDGRFGRLDRRSRGGFAGLQQPVALGSWRRGWLAGRHLVRGRLGRLLACRRLGRFVGCVFVRHGPVRPKPPRGDDAANVLYRMAAAGATAEAIPGSVRVGHARAALFVAPGHAPTIRRHRQGGDRRPLLGL